MKKLLTLSFAVMILMFAHNSQAQINVTGANTGNGSYLTLKLAFAAINGGSQAGTNILITITGNTNEGTASAILNAGTWTTLTISPSGGSWSISGATTAGSPLIDLNGADNVTIDGLNSGGNALNISNTTASATSGTSTIRFVTDATNNTVTRCTILGSPSMTLTTNGGIIYFAAGAVTSGNDNNTISFCNIGPQGANLPSKCIYSNGSTTSTTTYNSGMNINNCNFFDYFNSAASNAGIYLSGATTDWTINNNKFYQTATRTTTAASVTHAAIQLASSNINNCTISNNTIGYSNSAGTGTYTIAGAFSNAFYPIYCSAMGITTATTITNNTVRNISLTCSITASSIIYFSGINIGSGTANATSNTIGSSNDTGAISVTINGGNFTSNVIGISNSVGAAGNINNNIIGSITVNGSSTNSCSIRGINRSGTLPSAITISNNTIGSTTIANSIKQISTTRPGQLFGIISTAASSTITMDNNVISNLTNFSTWSTSTADFNTGIRHTGTSKATITNNTIRNITAYSAPSAVNVYGIYFINTATVQNVSSNNIFSLYSLTTSSSTYAQTVGLIGADVGSSGTLAKNRVYDLQNTCQNANAVIFGIIPFDGSWTCSNNQVTITNGEASFDRHKEHLKIDPSDNSNLAYSFNDDAEQNNLLTGQNKVADRLKRSLAKLSVTNSSSLNAVSIYGIGDETFTGDVWNFYYNSVYIGGSVTSGSSASFGYIRLNVGGTGTTVLKNNLLYVGRTGGSGFYIPIGNEASSPATGWTSNYNVLIGPDATTIGDWNVVLQTIDQWRTSSSGEKQSWSTTSTNLSAVNLFTDLSTGNLNIQSANSEAWVVNGKGIPISGQTTDYSGNPRSSSILSGASDIGSSEVSIDPSTNIPPSAVQSTPPGAGITSVYTLWSRTIASIDWGSGGSSYPTTLDVKYYSGVNPSNVSGGNYSNSNTSFVPTGTLTDATYDITYFFGDNETGTIGAPSSNTLLAKYDPTSWEVFRPGTGQYQTQLTYSTATQTYSAKVPGLYNFSSYALTDSASPLPVTISSFSAAASGRDAYITWTTASEINNKGFYLERRNKQISNIYSEWQSLGFIEGHGNSNTSNNYSYADKKLNLGAYQYRLKQVDYNGNFEYHSTTGQQDVIIGKPMSSEMSQNYPNPSNPKSKIDYQLPFDSKVTIKIFDLTGREVATLIDKNQEAGYFSTEFDGTNLASGIYFYRIIAQGNTEKFTKTLKMVLVK